MRNRVILVMLAVCLSFSCKRAEFAPCKIDYSIEALSSTNFILNVREGSTLQVDVSVNVVRSHCGLDPEPQKVPLSEPVKLHFFFPVPRPATNLDLVENDKEAIIETDLDGFATVTWEFRGEPGPRQLLVEFAEPGLLLLNDSIEIDQDQSSIVFSGIAFDCPESVEDGQESVLRKYRGGLFAGNCWLEDNMNAGSDIQFCLNFSDQKNLDIIEKYCYNISNCANPGTAELCEAGLGGLYQWYQIRRYDATSSDILRGICPEGFRLASDEDWKNLERELGISEPDLSEEIRVLDSQYALKFANPAATTPVEAQYNYKFGNGGFTIRKGGRAIIRKLSGSEIRIGNFSGLAKSGFYWTSTPVDGANATKAWAREIYVDDSLNQTVIRRFQANVSEGYSCKCVKDGY